MKLGRDVQNYSLFDSRSTPFTVREGLIKELLECMKGNGDSNIYWSAPIKINHLCKMSSDFVAFSFGLDLNPSFQSLLFYGPSNVFEGSIVSFYDTRQDILNLESSKNSLIELGVFSDVNVIEHINIENLFKMMSVEV